MKGNREHRARNFFQKGFHSLSAFEKKAVDVILHRLKHHDKQEQELTISQRMADKVASFGGSWTFILLGHSELGHPRKLVKRQGV